MELLGLDTPLKHSLMKFPIGSKWIRSNSAAEIFIRPTFTANDLMINSYGLPECLDWVEKESDWKMKKGNLGPYRGIGVAASHYLSGASKSVNWTGEPHATIHLKLDWDASITLLTGAPEIGQGSTTVITQCVAEVLGLDMTRIQSVTSDSEGHA